MIVENKDFIVAEKARGIDYQDPLKMIDGVLVGTQDHLFFVPSKTSATEHGYSHTTTTTETFFYEGETIKDYVTKKLKEFSSSDELHKHFMEELMPQAEGIVHLNLNEIGSFRVRAGWLGNGVTYKKDATKKFGWKAFSMGFGKKRKPIKAFYDSHKKNHETGK